MVVHNQEEIGEGLAMLTDPHHTPTIIQPSTSQPQKTQKPRRPKRKDIEVPQPSGPTTNVADKAVNEELNENLVRAATTASILEAEQDSGIDGIMYNLQSRVLALETTKTTQANEIAVESLDEEGLGEEDASKQGRIADIDANKDIYLVNVHIDEDMFGVNDLDGDEVIIDNVDVDKTAEETVNAAATTVSTASTILVSVATTTTTITTTVSNVEITLAQAPAELKSAVITRPKVKGIVIHEQEQAPTLTISSQQPSQVKVQDKGKGKMVKPELVKKMSKKYLLMLGEELAFKLQAKEEEEEARLAREKAQQIKGVNIA
ncbi:hypothetical protein Tco_1089048 [Tanacetum coccineum]